MQQESIASDTGDLSLPETMGDACTHLPSLDSVCMKYVDMERLGRFEHKFC